MDKQQEKNNDSGQKNTQISVSGNYIDIYENIMQQLWQVITVLYEYIL